MGNKFLDDLRQADALIHVIDASGGTNEKGEVVNEGNYNPAYDVKFLEFELDMWYLAILKKGWEKFARQQQQEKQKVGYALAKQLSGLNVTEEMIEDSVRKLGLSPQIITWEEEDLLKLTQALRRRTKPIIIAANKADTVSGEKNLSKLKEEFKEHIGLLLGYCAKAIDSIGEDAISVLKTIVTNNITRTHSGKL